MPIPLATLVTVQNEQNHNLISKNKYRALMGFSINDVSHGPMSLDLKQRGQLSNRDHNYT